MTAELSTLPRLEHRSIQENLPFMSVFAYRNGTLYAEEVPLHHLAAEIGTPFYCYSDALLETHFIAFQNALRRFDPLICYAMKANGHLAILRRFAKLGAGADIVSEGELIRALKAGIPPDKIVFAGVGKARPELIAALDAGILQFNIESEEELRLLSSLAEQRGKTARIALRINPDVDAKTHAKITTGKEGNKFGIAYHQAPALYQYARSLKGLSIVGLSIHIGSQLHSLEPFREAFTKIARLVLDLRGTGIAIRQLDLGGGLGVDYEQEQAPPIDAYAQLVADTVGHLNCQLIFEPGRALVGLAGLLVTQVIYVKQGEKRRFLILDAGMNDFMRPAFYEAYHTIQPLNEPAGALPQAPYDIVGPLCESSDVFAKDRLLPSLAPGDLVAIRGAGAYGMVMASNYTSRRFPAEIMVRGADFSVIRPRQSYEELLQAERLPAWLG